MSHIEVSEIMRGNKNAILVHDKKRYMLSITRRRKLILTIAGNATSEKASNNQK